MELWRTTSTNRKYDVDSVGAGLLADGRSPRGDAESGRDVVDCQHGPCWNARSLRARRCRLLPRGTYSRARRHSTAMAILILRLHDAAGCRLLNSRL